MTKIKELSQDVVNKIAAGEVVERPASVIKELVDNALDAGAKKIVVEIENGGLKKIRVVDNGEGMIREDLINSFLSHTTSKISEITDLNNLHSHGFRGEALASICSVSKTTIKSRYKTDDGGYLVTIEGGEITETNPVGNPIGTTVLVKDLFYNVPARKKFIKKPLTEYKVTLDILCSYALANINVSFKFSRDGKTVFDLKAGQPVENRVQVLLGSHFANNIFPIISSNEKVSVSGFLGKPQLATASKDSQFLYVNNRYVNNLVVERAVKKAYGRYLEPRDNPPFILHIKLDPVLVDINIHPRKEKVSFWDDHFISEFIETSVSEVLENVDLTYIKGGEIDLDKKASVYEFLSLKSSTNKWLLKDIADEEILQIEDTYLAVPVSGGLLLVDQHAAHESILYEEYKAEFEKEFSKKEKFQLEEPLLINLSITDTVFLKENISLFTDFGFEIEEFGQNTFRISQIPMLLKDHDIKSLVLELLSDIKETGKTASLDKKTEATIAFLSCRGAIKAGEKLTKEERRNLLEKLENSAGLYTCPHGRPLKVILTKRELEKLFKRSK